MIQKSAIPFDFYQTPEQVRDFSIFAKRFDEEYIGIVESYMIDSLQFYGYPAAMAGFVVDFDGDTLIHKQTVVVVDGEIYYLNNTFDQRDDGKLELLGDSILSTIKFLKNNN